MVYLHRITTSHEHYRYVEDLLKTAFPTEERRDSDKQREFTDHNPKFMPHVILDGSTPIGLLTLWNFTDFSYIEHFAIDKLLRNKGIGKQVLSILKEELQRPIILEVEEPTDYISKRRINFYKRQGFIIENYEYQQPPYRKGDKWIAMKLMSYNIKTDERINEKIRDTIYKEVYGINPTDLLMRKNKG